MQQFIVSADLHIKVSKEIPLEWQMNRYRLLFKTYVELCREHKAELVLAGDLVHNSKPNLHETMLLLELFSLLEGHNIFTHIIAGNHEALGAAGTTLDYLAPAIDDSGHISYYPEIKSRKMDNAELVFVGHNQLQTWLDGADTNYKGTRVVFSHFRPTVNFFIQEEIDVEKFLSTCSYCFAGDIHMPTSFCDGKLVYTSAPLNHTFERTPDCGALLVTIEDGKVTHKRIPLTLPNLIQIDTTAEKFEDTLDTFNFYRISVTGTPEDLRQIKTTSENTKLLKIPELQDTYVESEVVEEVKNQSLQEALVGYMQELNYTEEKIAEMIGVLHE